LYNKRRRKNPKLSKKRYVNKKLEVLTAIRIQFSILEIMTPCNVITTKILEKLLLPSSGSSDEE